jgi:hypothetical protein
LGLARAGAAAPGRLRGHGRAVRPGGRGAGEALQCTLAVYTHTRSLHTLHTRFACGLHTAYAHASPSRRSQGRRGPADLASLHSVQSLDASLHSLQSLEASLHSLQKLGLGKCRGRRGIRRAGEAALAVPSAPVYTVYTQFTDSLHSDNTVIRRAGKAAPSAPVYTVRHGLRAVYTQFVAHFHRDNAEAKQRPSSRTVLRTRSRRPPALHRAGFAHLLFTESKAGVNQV